jgi:hypothetical protein
MTAKEIREWTAQRQLNAYLREIAAQIAELNENIKSFDYKEGTRIFDVNVRPQ